MLGAIPMFVTINPRAITLERSAPGNWIALVTVPPPEIIHTVSLVDVSWFKRNDTLPSPLLVKQVAYGVA